MSARLYRFRSEEDPLAPPDPEMCAAAPFDPNVRLGVTLWADGDGVDEESEEDETRFVRPRPARG